MSLNREDLKSIRSIVEDVVEVIVERAISGSESRLRVEFREANSSLESRLRQEIQEVVSGSEGRLRKEIQEVVSSSESRLRIEVREAVSGSESRLRKEIAQSELRLKAYTDKQTNELAVIMFGYTNSLEMRLNEKLGLSTYEVK